MDFTIEKIPTWALCYILSDDPSGLCAEEIAMIDKWYADNNVMTVCPTANEDGECCSYFACHPAFGKASEVIDCQVMHI